MPNPALAVTDHGAKLASAVGLFFRAAVRGVSAADWPRLTILGVWVYRRITKLPSLLESEVDTNVSYGAAEL